MNKKFAIVMALFMALAGCTESIEDEIKEIVEIPGCDDSTAMNYDENATNSDACLTELALEQAIMNFLTVIEEGPTDANSSMGLTVTSTTADGSTSNMEMVYSPSGMAIFTSMSGEMDMGGVMMPLSFMSEQTVIPSPDGTDTTVIHMVYMDESQEFIMDNAVPWSVIVADMMSDEDHDDDHDMDGDHDDMDMDGDHDDGDHDMDGDHGDDDHGDDDMDMDMDMDLDMESPDPEDILSGFDVMNSSYALALSTDAGYSFTASMEDTYTDEDGSETTMTTTFTFVLDSTFKVTSISATSDMDSMTVTLLSDAEIAGYFDDDWSSGATEALPFAVMPMDGGHDDHGDDDHDDHGDDDHDDHGDHGDHHDGPTFICGDGTEIPFEYVNDNYADCDDGADEQQYDTDGDEINWFDCMDGSQVWISQVNDGTEDCPDGDDEAPDDHDDHDDHDDYELPSESDMFDMFDADGDGLLTLDEVMNGLDNMEEEIPTPEQALEQGDSDNSSGISWDEFVELWNSDEDEDDPEDNHLNNSPALESDFHEAFNNSDDDGSGELEEEELQDFIDLVSELSSDEHEHDRTFVCSSTVGGSPDTEISFELVNDGTEDCGDGSDEPQDMDPSVDSDGDGITDNDMDNWFDCYNGDQISMTLVNDGTEDCSMGEDEHDSEPWMMFDDCTDMSGSSPDGGSMWECFVDMDDDGTLTSEESMGMWYVCEFITMVDGDMWFCEPQHHEEGLSEGVLSVYFDAADADGDGMLSSDEFSLLYSMFDMGEDVDASVMLAILDSDGDGEVTASEYSDFMNATAGEDTIEGTDWEDFEIMIEMWDADNSGGLNVDELEEMYDSYEDDDHDGHDDHGDGGHDGHDDHGDGGHDDDDDDHDGHDHGDHDGHMHGPLEWLIVEADSMTDMPPIAGDLSNYYAVLSKCTIAEDSEDGSGDDDMMMDMGGSPDLTCGPDIMFTPLSSAGMGSEIMFHDADSSGTLTYGDMIHVSENATSEEWTHVRLYSASADAYSDENPMMTPGFTGLIGMIALLGAALLTRRD